MKRALLALVLLVSGCGVQATGAVPMGPAPTHVTPGAPSGLNQADLVLFFVSDGRIQGVARPSGGQASVATVLALLQKGPTADETNRGLVTFLPRSTAPLSVEITDIVTIRLPFPVEGLPPLATSQLACTAVTALSVNRIGNVRSDAVMLLGSEGAALQRGCDG